MEYLRSSFQEELEKKAGYRGPLNSSVIAKSVVKEVPSENCMYICVLILTLFSTNQGAGSVIVRMSEMAMDIRTVFVAVIIMGLEFDNSYPI